MLDRLKELVLEVSDTLKQHRLKLTTAESCTGGGLSYWLTSVPGSSAWFERGFVTYSNAAKMELLDVNEETLAREGAVSKECALEMAEGALTHSDAEISLSITGIAGPDGGTEEKPVGTVWIAASRKNHTSQVKEFLFSGDRQAIRLQSMEQALHLLKELIIFP